MLTKEMSEKKKIRKIELSTKFKEFFQSSTIHGMRYLAEAHWSQKITWIFILISSLTFCVYLSRMIYMKYLINPTVTVVETTHYSMSRVPFPAVTVCDTDLVYGPNTQNVTEILRKRGYNESLISQFYDSIYKIGEQKDVPPILPKIYSILEDVGYPLWTLLKMFSKPCDVLLMTCAWRSAIYNCSQMFRQVLTHRGYCCEFSLEYFKGRSQNVNYMSGHEPHKALKVVVDGVKINPFGSAREGNVEIFVFNSENGMTMLDSALPVRPNTQVDVTVEVWAIDTSHYVKTLPKETRKCILNSDGRPETSFYKGCVSNGFFEEMLNKCRCTPYYFQYSTLKKEYSNCTWEKYYCAHETFESFIGSSDAMAMKYSCYPSCDNFEYMTQAIYAPINVPSNIKSKNGSTVLVHFGDTTYVKYRRELLFTWDQMLASLGGIFGLSVGGSIISIIELIYFLLDLTFTAASFLITRRKTVVEQTDNQRTIIYTIRPKQTGNGKKLDKVKGTNIYPFAN